MYEFSLSSFTTVGKGTAATVEQRTSQSGMCIVLTILRSAFYSIFKMNSLILPLRYVLILTYSSYADCYLFVIRARNFSP